jgi:sarcosine oxidase
MVTHVRVAVVGAGVVGLATTAALLERGVEVVCFEARAPMAERSAGESRIFRLAHRDAQLVDLAAQSRHLYTRWEGQAEEQLIDQVGTVISGPGAHAYAQAMAAAGAVHLEVGPDCELLRLPTRQIPAVSVIDPEGGVIRADRVGTFLAARCAPAIRIEPVESLEDTAGGIVVRTITSAERFDALVLCAGAGTAALAAPVGLHPPTALAHHVRFTYRVKPGWPARMRCWITTTDDGFGSYQHTSAAGQWSVGAHVDAGQVAWEVGVEPAMKVSEEVTTAYVRSALDAVDPEVIDRLYCTVNADLSDGVQFLRAGRVLAVYGENLFKFAPLIGLRLAGAAVDGSLPAPMGGPQ